MSDIRLEMATIVKNSFMYNSEDSKKYKWYVYPDVSEKIVKIVKKKIAVDISMSSIVAVIDSSLMTSNDLLVLTTSGVYYSAFLMKKVFFNYTDIKDINKDNYINIKLQDDTIFYLSSIDYNLDLIRSLLINLKDYCKKNGLETKKKSGKVTQEEMPAELLEKCHVIIHGASVAAGGVGAGLAQLPCSDAAVITPIQIGMIVGLGEVFGLNITDGIAKGIITGAAGAVVGRGIVQVAVGWIPGVGNAINTATAAGLTEVIGWIAAYQFYQDSLDNVAKYSLDGEKRGYEAASELYEKKLRSQADEFLKQKKDMQKEIEEYEKLLSEYEDYIKELEKTCEDMKRLVEIKEIYEHLKGLAES